MDDRNFPSHTAGALAPALAQALARICEAEGVVPAQVRSIQIDDDEISVRIERLGGVSRIIIYPVAILAADGAKTSVRETDKSATE